MSLTPEELSTVVNHTHLGVARVAVDGRFLYVNPAYESLTGYTSAELLALRWQDITPPSDRDVDEKMVEEIVLGKRTTYDMQKAYNRKFNGIVPVWLRVIGCYNDGTLEHFIVTADPREARTQVTTSADQKSIHVSTAGRVTWGIHWKYLAAAGVAISGAVIAWLSQVQTTANIVQTNEQRIERVEDSLTEILRRIPPPKEG